MTKMKVTLTLGLLAVLVLTLCAAQEDAEIFPANACGFGRRMCTRIMKCVALTSLCDGKDDCGDNSDEEDCSPIGKRGVLVRSLLGCQPVNCFVDPCLTLNCGGRNCVRGCYCTATCQ